MNFIQRGIDLKYTNFYDMHTHSIHSFDGNHQISDLFDSALRQNAKGIAITDHCDIDGVDDYLKLCTEQSADFKATSKDYDKKLNTILGLEVGQGIYRKEQSEDIYLNLGYDFILGSIHNLENMEDFYFLDYKNYDVDKLLFRYFNDLLSLAQWGYFDSLAHLTYPLRYIIAREHIDVDISAYQEQMDAIFEALIKNRKSLEINTSGLFMDMKATLPDLPLIKRYRELGGEYITIGSDSHYADKVFQGINQGMDLALEAGFENITIYDSHTPILIPIK